MSVDYDGVQAIDPNGTSIGKVERTYIDDTNTPRYVEVKFGSILPRHRLIPVAGGNVTDDGRFQAAFDREVIEDSPAAPDVDTIESTDLDQIDSYYTGIGSEGDAATEPIPFTSQVDDERSDEQHEITHNQFEVVDESAGGLHVGDQVPAGMEAPIVDRGDIVEVPVLEEVLVKKTVVREILRVKKSDVVERETIEGDARKEEIEVEDPSGSVADSGVESTTR